MTAEDWRFITQVFGSLGIGAVAGGAVVHFFLKTFASSYLSEKGKNVATKEDIEDITRKVEEVKAELQARHTLQFAALDKRLEAHQQAFAHCRKLLRSLRGDGELLLALDSMSMWFDEHGLFLEKVASQSFWDAYYAALAYNNAQDNQPRDTKGMKENWDIIVSSHKAILKAVELPSLQLSGTEAPI
jgi:hypothetical protein